MKTTSVLFLLLLTGSLGFAQQYQPFPAANARWVERSERECPVLPPDYSYCIDRQYDITGDTIVNTLSYHKLRSTIVEYWYYQGVGCTDIFKSYSVHYAGSFREDIANRKIYFLAPDSANEHLLYDFNLNIGDTLPTLLINSTTVNWVSAIDSVSLLGIYHKRYIISADTIGYPSGFTTNYVALIEGIGSTFGLLSDLFPHWWFEAWGLDLLHCVSINGAAVYPDTVSFCTPVGIENPRVEKKLVEIFPNPAENNINIHLGSNFHDPLLFTLFNFMGQPVLTKRIDGKDVSLDIQSLLPGIFSYRIEGMNSGYSGKIIKIK